jgi:hypothetical protein
MASGDDTYFSVTDAAEIYGLDRTTVARWVRDGQVVAIKRFLEGVCNRRVYALTRQQVLVDIPALVEQNEVRLRGGLKARFAQARSRRMVESRSRKEKA